MKNLGRGTVAETIRKQLELNVRDGYTGPNTLDVVMGDKWETLPCSYQDGMFKVVRGNYEVWLKISVDVVREGTQY